MGSKLAIVFLMTLACLTCLSFSLPRKYSIVGDQDHLDLQEFVTEESLAELFQQWKEKHGKLYKNADEEEMRFQIFLKNLKYIIETNAKKLKYSVGLNAFSDMSNEEFRERYLSKVKMPFKKERKSMQGKVQSCDYPSSLDWRTKGVVTPVKNQETCRASWAFTATGAIESINAIVNGDLISLSEQQIIDCDTNSNGCDEGDAKTAFQWVVDNGGIETEADYPYTAVKGACTICQEETVSIDGYEDVDPTEMDLLCATVNQPISVAIDSSHVDFINYRTGIYEGGEDCSDNPDDTNHHLLIVGYGSEYSEDYWIVKNSWGTSWGMEGYGYIRRNTTYLPNGACAINTKASYPIKLPSPPSPYLNCDIGDGLCLKKSKNYLGVAAKKRKMIKRKFPWTKLEGTKKTYN